jgi:hypothetical protein
MSGGSPEFAASAEPPVEYIAKCHVAAGNKLRFLNHAIENINKSEHAFRLYKAIERELAIDVRRDFLLEKLGSTVSDRKLSFRSSPPPVDPVGQIAKPLVEFNLIETLKTRLFNEVRDLLANCQYSKLLAAAGALKSRARELDDVFQNSGKPRRHDLTLENLSAKMVAAARAFAEKGEGRYTGERNGGPNVSFGNGLPTTINTTVFYINPRLDQFGLALAIIADCLKGTDALVKIHTRAIDAEVENSKVVPDNKIVILLDSDKPEQVNSFVKRLAERADDLGPLLRPESLAQVMCSLRIPLMPGLTFVERAPRIGKAFDSWDDTIREKLKIEDWGEVKRVIVDRWRRDRNPPPSEAVWNHYMAVKEDSGRNASMPGLRA